jgi:NDP-sugar pyrophosphorylase family protein
VILAAGRGARMGHMTEEIPKPMLPIRGRPMLEHIIERLDEAGIRDALIVIGYHGDKIEQHFRSIPAAAPGVQLSFTPQNPVNGTGSGALCARNFAGSDPFLLLYGDILCEPVEYTRAAAILLANAKTTAVVAVKAVDDPWQGAAVYEHRGRITRILEKPPRGTSTTRWNSAGFYVFRPLVFEYLAKLEPSSRGEYELTSALEAMLRDGHDLRVSPIEGSWRDVGRPEDLAAMNEAG